MPEISFASASIAASSTSNVMAGRPEQLAPYPRTIQAIAVVIQDNTPALGDVTYKLRAGQTILAEGRGILANTAGPEITYPDGYKPVGMRINPNIPLSLEVTNADSGGAHSVLVSVLWDQA